ncbi:EAL domain-containing protein [Aerosakkonema funiforme]|uniref:EAL domain-containing protein n=1 Tax=Aerosakkonema funiforme TaxID=1246630 RepID=UPI0035B8C0C3
MDKLKIYGKSEYKDAFMMATYDVCLVVSVAIAIIAAYTALSQVKDSRFATKWKIELWLASGVAIAGIWSHYTGMTSARPWASIAYNSQLVELSTVISFGASLTTLCLTSMTKTTKIGKWCQISSAIAIASTIAATHCTVMAEVSFQPQKAKIVQLYSTADTRGSFTFSMAIAVGIATLVILALGRLAYAVDRQLRTQAATAEALRQSEQRFRSLVQNSSDLITVLGINGTFRYVSPSVERILGYKAEQLIDRKAFDWIHPEDIDKVCAAFASAIGNPGANMAIEYRVRHAEGNWIYLETIGHNLLDDVSIKGVVANSRNITKRKQAEEALRQVEQNYRSIFENAVEGIFQTTPDGRYLTVNPMLARIYGYNSPAELITTITDIKQQLYVDPNRRFQFRNLLQEQDAVWGFESQVYRKDGSIIWISESARALRDETGQLRGYEGTVVDITQRKQAETELHKRDRLLQGVAAAMNHLLTNSDYSAAINKALDALGGVTGVDRIYIYEQHCHPESGEIGVSMPYEWTRRLEEVERGRAEIKSQKSKVKSQNEERESGTTAESPRKAENVHHISPTPPLSKLRVPISIDEQLWGYIGFEDYRQQRQWSSGEESILIAMAASIGGALKRQRAEATIRYQAYHDLLTGLPNRTLLNDRLSLALERAYKHRHFMAVMFLDLDRFKTINDTLGHAVGDRLLQSATQRLKSCLRVDDTIARWGGDEFTILLPEINGIEDATKIAQRIIDVLKPTFDIEGHQLYITSSIGIAIYPQHGQDAHTLLINADAALYRAKAEGRNNYQIYTPAMNSQASELLELENSLHQAIEEQQFVVYYQPQVNVNTGEITHMEALIRWQHPQLGLISPKTFITLAEENGLIVPISTWVLQTACAQNKAWQDAGLPKVRIAVNLSVRQFEQPSLVETVARVLQETKLAPEFLELEITETIAMQNVDFSRAKIAQLQRMGIRIALDDFGIGYSSLNYLKKFGFDTLKIDRAFVRDLENDPQSAAITSAIIALGRGLNLSVVAEGVETVEQMNCLRSLDCEEMQGFLFSHPLSAEEASQLLIDNFRSQIVDFRLNSICNMK